MKDLYPAALGVYTKTNMTGSVLLYTLASEDHQIFYYEETMENKWNTGFVSEKVPSPVPVFTL